MTDKHFTCYKDRCLSGEEFCHIITQLCLQCTNFLDRCFTDRHISNCTVVCTNHVQSVTEITTGKQLGDITQTFTNSLYMENSQNSSQMFMPILAVIMVVILVVILLAVPCIRQMVVQKFNSWRNVIRSIIDRRAIRDETDLKTTNDDFIPIHSDTIIPMDCIGRNHNTGYADLQQNGDFQDQRCRPARYQRLQSSRDQQDSPPHANWPLNIDRHLSDSIPVQESQPLIDEGQQEGYPSHRNEPSQDTQTTPGDQLLREQLQGGQRKVVAQTSSEDQPYLKCQVVSFQNNIATDYVILKPVMSCSRVIDIVSR